MQLKLSIGAVLLCVSDAEVSDIVQKGERYLVRSFNSTHVILTTLDGTRKTGSLLHKRFANVSATRMVKDDDVALATDEISSEDALRDADNVYKYAVRVRIVASEIYFITWDPDKFKGARYGEYDKFSSNYSSHDIRYEMNNNFRGDSKDKVTWHLFDNESELVSWLAQEKEKARTKYQRVY